ncbi:MAG: hypothetical protein M3N32_03890 [Actinomycetota bacterium]|nr:hypothetical protein [Actinomycetota bacterium]
MGLAVAPAPTLRTRLQAARLLVTWMLDRPLAGDHVTGWRDVVLSPPPGEGLPDAPGRLWLVPRRSPAILLAAGVTPRGTADPRLMRIAAAISRVGHVVFAPELALARHRLDECDVERLITSTLALGTHPRVRGGVAMLGFSFGASYSLIAAADPRVAERLRLVAGLGGYGDLGGVIQAATTGVTLLDGERYEWRSKAPASLREPVVAAILRHGGLLGAETVEAVAAALRGEVDPTTLPHAARSIHDLVTNRDPTRNEKLVAALPPPLPELFARLSPVRVAEGVRAPVVLLHARDDPAIPHAELRRLAAAFPQAPAHTVRLFSHVDFRPSPRQLGKTARDLRAAWRFAAFLLAAGQRQGRLARRSPSSGRIQPGT